MSSPNNCIKRCNNTFPNCEECDNDITCKKCKEGYFFYAKNKSCIENITGCINNYYDGKIKECNECNMNKGYYCLNESKTVCHKMETTVVPYYYQIPELNYPCYQICDSLVKNCLKCNQTICHECTKRYIINDNGTYCFVKPFDVPDDDKCSIKYITYNKSIYEIDPWDFADYYWDNIPYISTVDHYIGENYTITVFTNSECTEDLLNNGYYKIDSKELQNKMIKEAGIEGMKIIFSVFINYNHKNHFRYHDLETKFLNPNKYCLSCLEIDYNITNKFYNPLKDALGLVAANLITSEKIEFVDRDSDIYTDTIDFRNIINYSRQPDITAYLDLEIGCTIEKTKDSYEFFTRVSKFTLFKYSEIGELKQEDFILEVNDDILVEFVGGILRVIPSNSKITECIINNCILEYGKLN
jgi:hypothetical protein